jgi:hypothetical protein
MPPPFWVNFSSPHRWKPARAIFYISGPKNPGKAKKSTETKRAGGFKIQKFRNPIGNFPFSFLFPLPVPSP